MGTPGTPIKIPRAKIVEALKKHKGKLTHVCKSLNIAYVTLQKLMKDDVELHQLTEQLRNELDCDLLDGAEDVLTYALSLRENDIDAALKSSFYILNNKGSSRGYVGIQKNPSSGGTVDEVRGAVRENQESPGDSASVRSPVATESSVLDQRQSRKQSEVSSKLGAKDSLDELFSM